MYEALHPEKIDEGMEVIQKRRMLTQDVLLKLLLQWWLNPTGDESTEYTLYLSHKRIRVQSLNLSTPVVSWVEDYSCSL